MTADARSDDPGTAEPDAVDQIADQSRPTADVPTMTTDAVVRPADAVALEAAPSAAVPATPAATAAADAPATSPRRLALAAGLLRILTLVLTFGLFAIGIVLGVGVYQRMQPGPTAVAAAPIVNMPAPAVVQEFVTALGSNDPDALRSAVPAEPYAQLVGEMQRWEFQQVTEVATLSTFTDGDRSATGIVLIGRDTAGVPVLINLVVQTQGGQIVVFR